MTHLKKLFHNVPCAIHRPIYSMVNNTTRVVSRPNQTLPDIEWNAGTVSRTVTTAEKTMRDVVKK